MSMKTDFERRYHSVEKKHWWFRVRRELLIKLVKKYFKNKKDLQILDIGCGTGLNSEALNSFGNVYSLDPSQSALQYCQQRGLTNVHCASVESLPFPDKKFDLVVALDVLEHIEDDKQAVQEINRVLKKGGVFISVLTDPTTGGIIASFASLGDIIVAEPKALIGFTGPRVIKQTIGQTLPNGFQRSEFSESQLQQL